MERTMFRLKTTGELLVLTYEEREAYCDALLAELNRVHELVNEPDLNPASANARSNGHGAAINAREDLHGIQP